MEYLIRPAAESDFVPLIRMGKSVVRKAYGDFIPIQALTPWLADGGETDRYLIGSLRRMQVAVHEGQVAGCFVLEDGMIDLVIVDTNLWGKGVGSALLEKAEGILRSAGYDKAQLECFEQNGRTVEFYRARGYRIRDSKMDPDAGVKKLLMEKAL